MRRESSTIVRVMIMSLFGVVGCDDPGSAKAGAGASANSNKASGPAVSASAPPESGLSRNDKALTIKTALATGTEGEQSVRLLLSTTELGCDAVKENYPELAKLQDKDDVLIDVWVGKNLHHDGTFGPWTFQQATVTDTNGTRGLQAQGAMFKKLAISEKAIDVTTLDLALRDLELADTEYRHQGDRSFSQCGRVKRPESARLQPKFKLSIAGVSFPVGGASLMPRGKRTILRLTRAPHVCSSLFTTGYDFFLDLAFQKGAGDADPPKLVLAAAQGAIFPDDPSTSAGLEKVKVTMQGKLSGNKPVTMRLDGNLDLHGYKLVLSGEVSPNRCVGR